MKILILGATGMLGNTLARYLGANPGFDVTVTIRSSAFPKNKPRNAQILYNLDVLSTNDLLSVFENRFDVVINCVGLIKQLDEAEDPLKVLPINSIFPHQLAKLCRSTGSRLIHISTDCVYSGLKGDYVEADIPDARDLYGISKRLGEVVDRSNVITIRTSIIGHELNSKRSLIDWFLSQTSSVKGYTKAIFSGLPTVELAKVLEKYVIPNDSLNGLYHISAESISKYDLLQLVAKIYEKKIKIEPYKDFEINRSLNSKKFREVTGFVPPSWEQLVESMKNFR